MWRYHAGFVGQMVLAKPDGDEEARVDSWCIKYTGQLTWFSRSHVGPTRAPHFEQIFMEPAWALFYFMDKGPVG